MLLLHLFLLRLSLLERSIPAPPPAPPAPHAPPPSPPSPPPDGEIFSFIWAFRALCLKQGINSILSLCSSLLLPLLPPLLPASLLLLLLLLLSSPSTSSQVQALHLFLLILHWIVSPATKLD